MDNKIECTQECLEVIARSVSNIFAGILRNTNKVKMAERDTSKGIISLTDYITNDSGVLIIADDEIESLKLALYEAVKLYGLSDTPCSGNLISNLHRPIVKLLNKFYLEKTNGNNRVVKNCNLFLKLKTIDPKYTIDDRYSGIWFSYGFDDKFIARMGVTSLCNIDFAGTGLEATPESVDDGIVIASDIYCGKVKDAKHDKTKITVLYKEVMSGENVAVTPGIFGIVCKFDNYREDENHVVSYLPINDFLHNVGLTSLIKKSYNLEEHSRIIEAIEGLSRLSDVELTTLPVAAKIAADWWGNAIKTSMDVRTPTEEQIEIFKKYLTSNIIFDIVRNPGNFSITNGNIDLGFKEAMEHAGITRPSIHGVVMSITPSKVIINYENETTVLYDGNIDVIKKTQL